MRWYQFVCAFLLFLLFTCHCIVVFHYLPSSSRWYITTLSFSISSFLIFVFLCSMLAMSVIPITCSFVIISFCSLLFICVEESGSYVFLHVHKTTSTNIHISSVSPRFVCVTNFYIFVLVYLKFVHATDCYIFIIIIEVCVPLIATFLSS